MRSDLALRTCVQVLVLLNLVFVQRTGAAGLGWLLPLYALTLAAPLLVRLQERLLYRLAWNGAVLAVFLLLLRHAQRAELASVLEDGLVLAVLCQVHLLNNLRANQRPDLLFFNAFLIALVAGTMNRDLGFALAFLVFAPCFVVGLQLLQATAAVRSPDPASTRLRSLDAGPTRRLVLDGARRAAVVLGASLLVFFLWPRDFEREAFFQGRLDRLQRTSGGLEVGFEDELDLTRRGDVTASDRPALRVTVLDGRSADVPALWRGATLAVPRRDGWFARATDGPAARTAVDADPWQGGDGRLVRPGPLPAGSARLEVVRLDPGTARLFAPLEARAVLLPPEHADADLQGLADGTLDLGRAGTVRYELTLPPASGRALGGPVLAEPGPDLAPFLELPASAGGDEARALAQRLADRLPPDAEQREIVAFLAEHLGRELRYLPPGSEGSAADLDTFVRGEAGGHCELFAAALATMLRSLGVPCRVATGYRSARWDPEGRVLTFAARDAHAWVEVHDPAGGWYAVDPTPAGAPVVAGASAWARLREAARGAWNAVTGFDAEGRAAALAWLRAAPAHLLAIAARHPLLAAAAAALLTAALALEARRRRRRSPPEVRAYRVALRRAGLRPRAGETPRELLDRARREGLPEVRVQALADATQRHEAARYAA